MPVCNYDGEVIGVAQIINKKNNNQDQTSQEDSQQFEFNEVDLKVRKKTSINTNNGASA